MRGQVAADRRADKERHSGNWKAKPEMEEVSLMLERSDLERCQTLLKFLLETSVTWFDILKDWSISASW